MFNGAYGTAIPYWIELNKAAAVSLSARCPCAISSNIYAHTHTHTHIHAKQSIEKWPDFNFCIFLFINIYLIYYGKKRERKKKRILLPFRKA